jgi:hypothetical protein
MLRYLSAEHLYLVTGELLPMFCTQIGTPRYIISIPASGDRLTIEYLHLNVVYEVEEGVDRLIGIDYTAPDMIYALCDNGTSQRYYIDDYPYNNDPNDSWTSTPDPSIPRFETYRYLLS